MLIEIVDSFTNFNLLYSSFLPPSFRVTKTWRAPMTRTPTTNLRTYSFNVSLGGITHPQH